jgi:acetolactate synthase-1/2/3 large subunit
VIDDGAYGVLAAWQRDRFGSDHGMALHQPDFVQLVGSYGVAVQRANTDTLADALAWAFAVEGPAVVVLEAQLRPPTVAR